MRSIPHFLTLLVVSTSCMTAGAAFAESVQKEKTRVKVLQELAQAQKSGDIIEGESGLKRNELYPHLYPKVQVESSKTRAEVINEFRKARSSGDLYAGDTSLRLNQVRPDLYPQENPRASGLTREQVLQDLASAKAQNTLFTGGEDGYPSTP